MTETPAKAPPDWREFAERAATPLGRRQARYARLKERTGWMTLEEAGAAEDPPITKERVRQILAQEPRANGRPVGSPTKKPASFAGVTSPIERVDFKSRVDRKKKEATPD